MKTIERYDTIPEDVTKLPKCFELRVPTRKITTTKNRDLQIELKAYRDFARSMTQVNGYAMVEYTEEGKGTVWRFTKGDIKIGWS